MQVFQRWLAAHGRTAASHFKDEQLRAAEARKTSSGNGTAANPGGHARRPSVLQVGNAVAASAVVTRLMNGVGRAPIQLSRCGCFEL